MNSDFETSDQQRSAGGDDRTTNNNIMAMAASKTPSSLTNNNAAASNSTTTAANNNDRDVPMDDEDMDSGSSPNSLSNETGGDRDPNSTDSSPIDSNSSGSQNNASQHHHLGSSASNSSASPVRRLPSVLRPPTSVHNNPQSASGHILAQRQMYASNGNGDSTPTGGSPYGAGTAAAMSMRSFYADTMGNDAQSRSYGHERIHMQPQSAGGSPSAGAAAHSSSPHDDVDSDSSARGQKRRLGQFDPRAYTRDHHRSSPSAAPSSSNNNNNNSNGANVLAAAAAISRQQQHHNHLQHQQQTILLHDEDDDDESSTNFGDSSRGSHGPRDEMRYETWTSKQLRKKCSHLKLRGLKNVKKHVMVEALYRYYRTQRQKELLGPNNIAAGGSVKASDGNLTNSSSMTNDQQQQPSNYNNSRSGAHYDHHSSSSVAAYNSTNNNATINRSRITSGQSDRTHAIGASSSSGSSQPKTNNHGSASLNRKQQQLQQVHASGAKSPSATVVRHRAVSYNDDQDMDDDHHHNNNATTTRDHLDNEIHVTSEDVIRLVDVVLSPVFVDRLAVELSRWQFWVDVREKYIAMLKTTPASNYGSARATHAGSGGGSSLSLSGADQPDALNRAAHMSMISSRNFKWSSMQLWEIWKELTFAYTKTCFEFTAAGMKSEKNPDAGRLTIRLLLVDGRLWTIDFTNIFYFLFFIYVYLIV